MNNLKTISMLFMAILFMVSCNNQKTTDKEVNTVDITAEKQAVTTVLKNYKDANSKFKRRRNFSSFF